MNSEEHSDDENIPKRNELNEPVFINFGPTEAYGILEHRTERLEGIVGMLLSEGFHVILVPFKYRNLVEIIVHKEVVFRTEVRLLHFGGDGYLDPVACAAHASVKQHFILSCTPRT